MEIKVMIPSPAVNFNLDRTCTSLYVNAPSSLQRFDEEKLHCLIPAPKRYVTPFPWPKSRDYVPLSNAPYKSSTVEKVVQNWIQNEGNVFRFPGGGTHFPHGADAYIDQLASVIPIDNGTARNALDMGCGIISLESDKQDTLNITFVTRDNKGIGLKISRQLGSNGMIVVLTTRDEKRGVEAVENLKSFGLCDVIFHQLDVNDTVSVASLVNFIKNKG